MPHRKELIKKAASKKGYQFIIQNVELDNAIVLSSNTMFNFENIATQNNQAIINLKRVNDFKDINQYFATVNQKLKTDGIFINLAETYIARKQRILQKYLKPFNWIYYIGDVFVTRIAPKLYLTQKLYFYLSGGKGKVLSKTEIFGRLYFSGFQLLDEKIIDNQLYFIAQKIKEPKDKNTTSSYRFLIKLPRIGKNGKTIWVY
ncbi:MAG: hypothetical protein ACOVQ2_10505, partial [Flavobacterium sp.]